MFGHHLVPRPRSIPVLLRPRRRGRALRVRLYFRADLCERADPGREQALVVLDDAIGLPQQGGCLFRPSRTGQVIGLADDSALAGIRATPTTSRLGRGW